MHARSMAPEGEFSESRVIKFLPPDDCEGPQEACFEEDGHGLIESPNMTPPPASNKHGRTTPQSDESQGVVKKLRPAELNMPMEESLFTPAGAPHVAAHPMEAGGEEQDPPAYDSDGTQEYEIEYEQRYGAAPPDQLKPEEENNGNWYWNTDWCLDNLKDRVNSLERKGPQPQQQQSLEILREVMALLQKEFAELRTNLDQTVNEWQTK